MTWGELREDILDYSGNTDPEFSLKIPSFVKQAEAQIAMLAKLPAYAVPGTLSIASMTSTVTTPSGFISVDYIAIPTYGILEQKDPSYIREVWPDPGEIGQPRVFAIQSVQSASAGPQTVILLGPTPDKAYTANWQYFAKWPSLVDLGIASGTQNEETFISSTFPGALLHGALEQVAYYQMDADMIQAEHNKFLECLGLVPKFKDGRNKRDEAEAQSSSIAAQDI
jgi:hypothetical protein